MAQVNQPNPSSGGHQQSSDTPSESHSQQQQGQGNTPGQGQQGGAFGRFLSRALDYGKQAVGNVPALDQIKHDVRSSAVMYDPRQSPHTMKLQVAIKSQKALATSIHTSAQASRFFSSSFYDWSECQTREGSNDIKDTSDRLAWFQFEQGALQDEYSSKIEKSRAILKELRNYEHSLNEARNARAELQKRIKHLENQTTPASKDKLTLALEELEQVDKDNKENEDSVEAFKRQKLKEAFDLEFKAMKEYGEKLAILAQHGSTLVQCGFQQDVQQQEDAASKTAQIRTLAEDDLKAWDPNNPRIPPSNTPSDLHESNLHHTPSFGETHKDELAAIAYAHVNRDSSGSQDVPPPPPSQLQHQEQQPPPVYHDPSPSTQRKSSISKSTPSDASILPQLNMNPASSQAPLVTDEKPSVGTTETPLPPMPAAVSPPMHSAPLPASQASATRRMSVEGPSPPATEPTIAETGAPIVSGTGGPGPHSGSLPDRRKSSVSAGSTNTASTATQQQQQQSQKQDTLPPPSYSATNSGEKSGDDDSSAPSNLSTTAVHGSVPQTPNATDSK